MTRLTGEEAFDLLQMLTNQTCWELTAIALNRSVDGISEYVGKTSLNAFNNMTEDDSRVFLAAYYANRDKFIEEYDLESEERDLED